MPKKSAKRRAIKRRNPEIQATREGKEVLNELKYVEQILDSRIKFIERTGRTEGEYVNMLKMYLKDMKPSIRKLYNLAVEYQFNIRDDHMED